MPNKRYQKRKERLRKEARGKYQNLSEEEKGKRRKRSKKDTKIFLENKSRNYLSI